MKILIAGDFVPHRRTAVHIEAGDYSCLDEVKPIVQAADYAIVNFESPVVTREAQPIDKTGPNLRCTEQAMECVSQAGFNCVTLANNHFRDYGQVGVEDTVETCRKYGLDYVGGGATREGASRILYKEIDGKRLAIVNICESEWSIATEQYGGSNPLNTVQNYYAIQEAKNKADYVLVIVHGGIELYQYPTPRMQETYRFFVDAGADAVVNHHQHCFSGYEVYHNKPIFYGLGNFCFDNNMPTGDIWNSGYMVEIIIEDKIGYAIFPYTQCEESACVHLISDNQRQLFDKEINRINETIRESDRIIAVFEDYTNIIKDSKLDALEPIYNRYLKYLQKKHIFPRFFKGSTEKDWLCRLNCDSHREVVKSVIGKDLQK